MKNFKFLIAILSLSLAVLALSARAETPTVLCIGDSLTYGEGGNGTSWPSVLAKEGHLNAINRGRSGWIPRHLKYAFLLQDCRTLTTDELRAIPPQEYENRINQPEINNLRRLISDGQLTTVIQDGHSIVYQWDSACRQDGSHMLKPMAVENQGHKPVIPSGRWIASNKIRPAPLNPDIWIFWIGANGMESEDLTQSLHDMLAHCGKNPRFLVLGLINRQYPTSSPAGIARWAKLINECNNSLRSAYPDQFVDLQNWFTSSGKDKKEATDHPQAADKQPRMGTYYKTKEWFANASLAEIADDEADQRLGVVPRSLRAPKNLTHLNADGYRIIGIMVHQRLMEKGWLTQTPSQAGQ